MKKTLSLTQGGLGTSPLTLEGDLSSAREAMSNKGKAKGSKVGKSSSLSVDSPKKKSPKKKSSKKKSSKKKSPKKKSSKKTKRSSSARKSGGGLDRSTVATVLNQNGRGLEHCYRRALKKDPAFGEVNTRLNFMVNPNGRVSRSTIKLSGVYRKTRLESCIQNTVVRWYFPKAKGKTPVRYPLRFRPGF